MAEAKNSDLVKILENDKQLRVTRWLKSGFYAMSLFNFGVYVKSLADDLYFVVKYEHAEIPGTGLMFLGSAVLLMLLGTYIGERAKDIRNRKLAELILNYKEQK